MTLSEDVSGAGRRYVWDHAAAPHRGGVAVAYHSEGIRDARDLAPFETRVLELDDEAQLQDEPVVTLQRMNGRDRSGVPPSIAGGCEVHALDFLETPEPSFRSARLAILDSWLGLEVLEVQGEVWDVQRHEEEVSWQEWRDGWSVVTADRRGRPIRRVQLELLRGPFIGHSSRRLLADGTFVVAVHGLSRGVVLLHYGATGALLAERPIDDRSMWHSVFVSREGVPWLFWVAHLETSRNALAARPLAEDGAVGPTVRFELDGQNVPSTLTPMWLAGHWLVPVTDRDARTGVLGLFHEQGRSREEIALGGPLDSAHLVPTTRGALLTYAEAVTSGGGVVERIVLRARALRCAP